MSIFQIHQCFVALNKDNRVVIWGNRELGNVTNFIPQAESLRDVKSISCSTSCMAALCLDGTVVVVGHNSFNQLDVPEGLGDVMSVICMEKCVVTLKNDGIVVVWGSIEDNFYIPEGLNDVKSIYGMHGGGYVVALKYDGTIVCWGNINQLAKYGLANIPHELNANDVKTIRCTHEHILVLKNDGTVVAWGDNSFGRCDVPLGLTVVKSIHAGNGYCFAVRHNKSIVYWGLGFEDAKVTMESLTEYKSIHSGYFSVVVVNNDGTALKICVVFNQPESLENFNDISQIHFTKSVFWGVKSDGSIVSSNLGLLGNNPHYIDVPEDFRMNTSSEEDDDWRNNLEIILK